MYHCHITATMLTPRCRSVVSPFCCCLAHAFQQAQAPMLEMTKNLLQEQKDKLDAEKFRLAQENAKLKEKVRLVTS